MNFYLSLKQFYDGRRDFRFIWKLEKLKKNLKILSKVRKFNEYSKKY